MRTILHSDLNNFYASVEVKKHPECKDLPIVVCGNVEERHGVVLAKNQIAKALGVKTGDVLWEAKRKCGEKLVSFTADFPAYTEISRQVRAIYARFTDRIESFGIDECWLDVTDSVALFGDGESIAEQIRKAVKEEIGVTVSIGVSYNKIFAKLGSDMKKPDAITVISPENFKQTVWKLPIEDLLYVGKATKKKLNKLGIMTIGDIATVDVKILSNVLGVWGRNLYKYANGYDDSPVLKKNETADAKSIGNSLTDYKDLENFEEVKTLIMLLAESVASRLRSSGLGKARTVKLGITDNTLKTIGKQTTLARATSSSVDIARACYGLFEGLYKWENPVRGISVSVCNFTLDREQLSIDSVRDDKTDRLDKAVDGIRQKYGNNSVQRARILQDKKLAETDIKGEHTIRPGGLV